MKMLIAASLILGALSTSAGAVDMAELAPCKPAAARLCDRSAGMTWSDAQAYCATVGAGFRLPTAKELASLVDLTVTTGPTLDQTAFPDAAPEELWTSSLLAGSSDYAWSIFFYDGTSFLSDVSYTYRARCVR